MEELPEHGRPGSVWPDAQAQPELSGEGILFHQQDVSQEIPRRPYWLHALLFLLTIFTTLVVGARLDHQFRADLPIFVQDERFFSLRWALRNPSALWSGVPFSAALLSILLAHEFGHFVLSVRNRVYATLPYFLPAPTPIGTLGAFIQIRSRFGSLNALFDIAVAGPWAGYVVALPLTFVGLRMSKLVAHGSGLLMAIGNPVSFEVAYRMLGAAGWEAARVVPLRNVYFHPVAVAAWVGMLATSLNLLPGGQLDGGHMTYAMFPRAHKLVTRLSILVLVPVGFFYWSGWLVWAVALFLTSRHPQVQQTPALSTGRRIGFWLSMLLLFVTFIPMPFEGASVMEVIREALH